MHRIALAMALMALVPLVLSEGDFGDFGAKKTKLTAEEINRFLTDERIVDGDITDIQKCSDKVFEARKRVAANGGPTLGVEPTVGLGAALIIFLLVGIFAAGIAQAFQQVCSQTKKGEKKHGNN